MARYSQNANKGASDTDLASDRSEDVDEVEFLSLLLDDLGFRILYGVTFNNQLGESVYTRKKKMEMTYSSIAR